MYYICIYKKIGDSTSDDDSDSTDEEEERRKDKELVRKQREIENAKQKLLEEGIN